MAVLEILTYPDPRLRRAGKPVAKVTPELAQLAQDMLETMYHSHGIGLAAPQVGESIRLLVMDTRPRENGRYKLEDMTDLEKVVNFPLIIFNPVLIAKRGKTSFDEGCLSVPTYFETVERAEYVEVEGLNEKGEKIVIKSDGLVAICLQHEMDHLDGKLFIDRLSLIKSNRIKSRIKKFGYPNKEEAENQEKEEVSL